MRRHYRNVVTLSFAAALLAPAVAQAQPGDRPATQLFFAPTGRVLPKGDGYVKGLSLAVPHFQGGLTDRFSVGVGIYGLGRAAIVTPKFQIQRSANHSTSIGALEVLAAGGSGGIAYVAHTIERKNGAAHVALLTPITHRWGQQAVVLMLGGERRLSDRVTFMTENYLYAGGLPIVSSGVRVRAPHTTWDFGLLLPFGFTYGAHPSPMINGGWKF